MRSAWMILMGAVALAACSSGGSPPSPSSPSSGAEKALGTFDGTFDAATGQMSFAFHQPGAGGTRSLATLPYGTGASQVYLHTLPGSVSWLAGTNQLTGSVAPVNGFTLPIAHFTAVIDSTNPTTAVATAPFTGTPSSLDYGYVPAGTGDAQKWTFDNPTGGSFSFSGHVAGTVCQQDLSGAGTGDFSIAFTLASAGSGSNFAVLNQRNVCGQQIMWDIRMDASGLLGIEVDDNSTLHGFNSTKTVNDGNPHDVVVRRTSGTVAFTIDGAAAGSSGAPSGNMSTLPPLEIQNDPCVGADGTQPLPGTVSNVCVSF